MARAGSTSAKSDTRMSKAFTTETDREDEDEREEAETIPAGVKNYMTPAGFAVLQEELRQLTNEERPKVVEIVSWAAGNGDRSENGDYIYGKKRLREIDRRIRYLMKRLESADVIDPKKQKSLERVFFGATVSYKRGGETQTVTLVGVDEADMGGNKISWLSPVARALMKSAVGDMVELRTPAGTETLHVTDLYYGDE